MSHASTLWCMLALAPMAAAQPQFSELRMQQLPDVRMEAYAAAAGDLDGDGDQDLVTAAVLPRITLNHDGVLRMHPFTAGATARDLALGDVDGDGDLDLALRTSGVVIFRNDGAANFTGPETLPVGPSGPLKFEDIDGDGDQDLLIGGQLLENDGTGTFTPKVLVTGSSVLAAAFGDVDGDGNRDLILSVVDSLAATHEVALYQRTGAGTFQKFPGAFPAIETPVVTLAVGDLDRDGDLDLVGSGENNVAFQNDGTGQFADDSVRRFGHVPPIQYLILADIDADGLPDLVGSDQDGSRFHRNDGRSFGQATTISDLTAYTRPATIDAFGDGKLQIVLPTARQYRDRMFALRGDRFVELTANPGVPTAEGSGYPGSELVADFDGDGHQDLLRTDLHAPAVHRLWLQGATGFDPARIRQFPADSTGSGAAFDADGDGDLDVVYGARTNSEAASLLINDGAGNFADETSVRLGSVRGWSPTAIDLDHDGAVDLVFDVGTELATYTNQGGTFVASPSTALDAVPGIAATLDAELDGDTDILDETGRIHLNDGTGNFVAGWRSPFPFTTVHVADIDGDGDEDLFLGHTLGSPRLVRNNGDGGFSDVTATQMLLTFPAYLAGAVDVDADGDVDAVFRTPPGKLAIEWLENDGDGFFSSVAGRSSDLRWGTIIDNLDVDGDGDEDLIVRFADSPIANPKSMITTVYRNLQSQLDVPTAPRLGGSLVVEAHMNDGLSGTPRLAIPFVDAKLASTPLAAGSFGTWYLDPATAIQLPAFRVPGAMASQTYILPGRANAMLTDLFLQAVLISDQDPSAWRLSNVVVRPLLR